MFSISRFYPADRIRMFVPRFGNTLLSQCIVMTKQTINLGFLPHVIATDFSRFRLARVLLYLHRPLSDIQSKECWLASLVETGGVGNDREMGIKFSADARKEFPQHSDRFWDPPSLLSKGHRDSFSCHGFSSWGKRHLQVGSGAHPPFLPMGTRGNFRERQLRGHETDHNAIRCDLKKPLRLSCVIKPFVVTW